MKWKCKNGSVIEIRDMETGHLKNAIAMLRRKQFVTVNEFLSCSAYAHSSRTPDGAAMAAEDALNSMNPCNELQEMEDELKQRTP